VSPRGYDSGSNDEWRFRLPTLGQESVSWDVVKCHHLAFDVEAGHVEMWDALIVRLVTAWHKDVAAFKRALENCPYGLPRGRVPRLGKRFLVLHSDDWPYADGPGPVTEYFTFLLIR
jgi:hypothetical protein